MDPNEIEIKHEWETGMNEGSWLYDRACLTDEDELKTSKFIMAVSETVFDMINLVYRQAFGFYQSYISAEACLPSSGSE